MKIQTLLLALIALATTAHAASTVAVGTCHAPTPSYATIQQAVDAVSSGGTVLVCPGNYAEQITIHQPLTLKGIAAGVQQAVALYAPASGLLVNYTSSSLSDVTAHIFVQTAGLVTISNIDVEGLGATCPSAYTEVGIAAVNSNLTVTNSALRNISSVQGNCNGVAINAEGSGNLSVQNSMLNGFLTGIQTEGGNTALISGNLLSDGDYGIGINNPVSTATISANTLQNIGDPSYPQPLGNGIFVVGAVPGTHILNNIIGMSRNADSSIVWSGVATVTGNKTSGGTYGIRMNGAAKSTLQSNIVSNSTVGLQITEQKGAGSNLITKNTFKFDGCALWTVSSIADTVTANTFVGNKFTACP